MEHGKMFYMQTNEWVFMFWIMDMDTDDGQNILHDCYGDDYTESYAESYRKCEESIERERERARELKRQRNSECVYYVG